METRLIDNNKVLLIDILSENIQSAEKIKFAIAFVKQSGFSKIQNDLNSFINKGNPAEIVLGLDFRTTDPYVLHALANIKAPNFHFWCFSNPENDHAATYHPKLYLFEKKDSVEIIIGSSNLTLGGLQNNVELNVRISSNSKEEFVSDVFEAFNYIKFQQYCFFPSNEYLDLYETAYKEANQRKIDKRKILIKDLKHLENELPHPIADPNDLVGWMKLVYERLPNTSFSTNDLYSYENLFKEFYPSNRNIRAKIRQQLQFLRNMNLIENPERNLWKKIK